MQKKRWIHWLEEFILIVLILFSILSFFEILPADLEFVKKIISWTTLGYLLYKASLTKIFFNNRHKYIDILLILSYFMLIFKNIIIFSSGILEEFVVFHDFQSFIVDNSSTLEFYFLIIGSIFILLLAVYSAFLIDIRKPSLMYIIHVQGKPNNLLKLLIRIVSVYLVYIAFFVVVFNLVMEWLTIAIDAPIIMIAILAYLFIVIRHYKKYNIENLIYKIGEFGESFYEKFISLFHYPKTILLGISGMLVFHLLTDAISFIIPFIFVFKNSIYFSQLGLGHEPLISLFFQQIENREFLEQFSLFFIYILNAIGILLLLLLPPFFWYIAFTGNKFKISKFNISLILSSISIFLIAPVFSMGRLSNNVILGVDITTNFVNNILFTNFFQVFFFAFIFFLMIYFLSDYYKKHLLYLIILISTLFLIYYIFLFFTSLLFYYIDIIHALFITSRFVLSSYFFLFLIINILFYVAGFIMFVDEILKEKVYKKFS